MGRTTYVRCTILAACLVTALGSSLEAQVTIDKQITIMPIQVRSSNGSIVANPTQQLYEAVADKIWSQAGIDIKFLPWETYNSDNYITVSSAPGDADSLLNLSQLAGQPWSSVGANVLKLFFVQQIDGSNSNYGYTIQSGLTIGIGNAVVIDQQTAVAIADSAINSGVVDVIAHEIGHALGLNHTTLGAGGALNLMTDGGPKQEVFSINDIYPDGADASFLTGTIGGTSWGDDLTPGLAGFQIDRARRMDISVNLPLNEQYVYGAVPEPSATAAVAGALMILVTGAVRHARNRKSRKTIPLERVVDCA